MASVLFHAVIVALIISIQMFGPGRIAGVDLLTTLYMAPEPPPAPLPPPPPGDPDPERKTTEPGKPGVAEVRSAKPEDVKRVEEPALIQPITINKDVADIAGSAPTAGRGGTIGGIPGGVPGGIPGGVLGGRMGGVLGGVANPPPPPPPQEPIRVGGSIREPKITKMVQPVYPALAVKQRIEGVVVIEATVTETGQVDKVKVISGPPALVNAAMDAVKQWRYEPTTLNGTPVPVLLTARVSFSLKNH